MEKEARWLGSPHIRGTMSTARIMQCVILALLPTAIFGVVNFGIRALFHMIICIVTCVLSEFTFEAFTDHPLTVTDGSAVVTGFLLAFSLPVGVPLWLGVIGGIFAILIMKMLFGGIGQNVVNPALAGWCFLRFFFSGPMSEFTCDTYTGATPLAVLGEGGMVDPLPMILGNTGGSIGETSTIAILVGAILLLALGIISLWIPVSCIVSFILCLILFGGRGIDEVYLVTQLCGGGMMLAVWFMATDYVTSPITGRGKVLYGIIIGVSAAAVRITGVAEEGIAYAVLFGNLLVPLIDKITEPKAFGEKRRRVN